MELSKKITFDRNKMATTVGANSLNVETIVSQPSNAQDELMVDGLDYVFNQAKFEEHLSSSSSRSSSPKRRRILSPRKTQREDFPPIVVKAFPCNIIPASPKAEGPAHQSATTLTKRARQRRRQKLARQLAKVMESTDGIHYRTNSRGQRRQQITAPQSQTVSTPAEEEWVLVKRTRSTKKERAQRRRARAAHARAIIRKAQELRSAKGSTRSHQTWVPKSAQDPSQETAQNLVIGQNSHNCLGHSRDSHNCHGQSRDSRDCRGQGRDSIGCRAQRSFSRDCIGCRADGSHGRDTPNCLGQGGSPPLLLHASPADVPTAKFPTSVFSRLGPKPGIKGKEPATECLGHPVRTQQQTGGSIQTPPDVQKRSKQSGTSQASKVPVASRLSIPQGVRESAERKKLKHVTRKVTKDDQTLVIHAEATSDDEAKRMRVSPRLNGRRPQKKTCPPVKNHVTLGGGNVTCDKPHQPCHQAGGDNTRKRTINEIDCSCSCAQMIKTLLLGCACSESNAHPQRASVFERLSLPATEDLKPESRRSRRRRRSSIQFDELSEVTINMVNKGKGPATDVDPDFTPGGKVSSQISQRMSRLQLRATQRIDYRRMHEGESSEDEISDACSAIASDDTMSSVGQAREAFTITPETLAQMLQEALAKQKEDLKAEMRTEMELAMQQMREVQNQTTPQPESSQQGGATQHLAHDIEDSDTEVDEHILADQPPQKTASGAQSGGGLTNPLGNNPKQGNDNDGKMKELEGKINALMSAQEVKKTGIPCPYPREWDSIPYPPKFNLINFTPFDGKGSPTQHLIYFKSHLGVISGNEPLMVRSFVGTLRGAAFDWYRRLKAGSINCWDEMESSFLSNFFDDDTEVSIRTLLDEKQKGGETTDAFVKRFRNKAINCKDPITEKFILQTCHNNLSIDLLEVIGVAPPTTWKELKLRGEQAERFLKRKKNESGEPTTGPSNSNFASHDKKKASTAAVNQKLQQQQRKTSDRRFQKEYSFKDEEVSVIFKYLLDGNKIKLPPITNQEEADKTSDPKYCAYHRRILHPTKDCIALKAIIQALVEAGVLTPK